MENWLDSYSMMLNSKPFEIKEKKGALIGFNVNIDKIIEINPTIIMNIVTPKISNQLDLTKDSPTNIESVADFLSCLFHSIEHEKADEVLTNSKQLANWIETTFKIKAVKIGGQAGIIANLYSMIGLKKVLLSLPAPSVELTRLLNPNILTILKDDSGYSIDKISKINNKMEMPINHYVFEFTKGTYVIGPHTIKCKRANRFILSHDEINNQLMFNKGFVDYCDEFLSEYSLAIISGFHLINQKTNPSQTFYDAIKPIETMLKKWKRSNSLLCLHLEIASTKDIELRKTIVNTLFPIINSIGLNEQELISFIEVLNPKIAYEMQESLESVLVFKALNMILQKYPNLRIHFHYLGYFLILSKPVEQERAMIRKKGLLLSSLLASIRAKGMEITSLDEIREAFLDISKKGLESLKHLQDYLVSEYQEQGNLLTDGIFKSPFFSLIGVPTIIVKNPKLTVGLGDLISSISIFYETQ